MMYRVELSAQAKEDMREIYEYIAFELRAIDSTEALFRHLEEHIYALEEMPKCLNGIGSMKVSRGARAVFALCLSTIISFSTYRITRAAL